MKLPSAWDNGDLEMVKWLHKKNIEGCTSRTMDRAVKNGHLDIVKWLHVNRTEGCTGDAALKNHVDIVKLLQKK